MSSKTPIHHQREKHNRSFRLRTMILVGIFALLILTYCGRLIQLQWANYSHYSSLSQNNLLTYIPRAPSRGLITDRNGEMLAINKPSSTLALMPNKKRKLQATIRAIRKIIPISQREERLFFRSLGQYRHYQPIPLKTRLTEKEVALFYTNQFKFPGSLIRAELIRDYPTGSTMGAILGYVGRINSQDKKRINYNNYQAQPVIGKTGLERQYESILHGQSGAEAAATNANGHIIDLLDHHPATAGKNLTLTIDLRLQKKAQQLLKGIEGSIVMLDPRNGEILAMANAPTFDNNLFSGGISHANYNKLLKDPYHPLFNRALRGRFSPGSTVKPFYALMALNDKLIEPNTLIYDKGTYQVPGTQHVYHDWTWFIGRGGHGWVNAKKAIESSCDTFFYDLAYKMGIRSMTDIWRQFGFGQKTGIDLPHELAGIAPSPDWKRGHFGKSWYTGDTIEAGIGQGYLSVTPLQLASSVGMLAMHGHRFRPHLLRATSNNNEAATIRPGEEILPAVTASEQAWKTMLRGMRAVIDGRDGTAFHFGSHRHFSVAGKTGTAQVYGHRRDEVMTRTNIPKKLRNNHLFIAFAPVEHPTVVIAVILEHQANADRKAGILLREYFKLQRADQKREQQHEKSTQK